MPTPHCLPAFPPGLPQTCVVRHPGYLWRNGTAAPRHPIMTLLTKQQTESGPRWALNGRLLADGFTLGRLLGDSVAAARERLQAWPLEGPGVGRLLAPVDDDQEVWASGVTYLRSRQAREAESQVADVYQKVYEAERPELFFKSAGWRAKGNGETVRIRRDSSWNVPEPELTLVLTADGGVFGCTAGNDMSSRSIEGENPLYLPQAKVYDGSCAVGPSIRVMDVDDMRSMRIALRILRRGEVVFDDQVNSDRMKRTLEELAGWLVRELSFPRGVLLMTGTGLVPPEGFTLEVGDTVVIDLDGQTLHNTVA